MLSDGGDHFRQRGILLAIEGIDGAGKTTQVRLLQRALEELREPVITSKEPTNGKWGSILRNSAATGRLSLSDELSTFIKDRTEHVETLVNPNLQAGKVVILDRYFYSTIAYQGARGENVEQITNDMNRLFPVPDAVFILDVDPLTGIRRIAKGRGEEPNQFEDHHTLTQARFIFNAMRGIEIHLIDGSLPINVVHDAIMRVVMELILLPYPNA